MWKRNGSHNLIYQFCCAKPLKERQILTLITYLPVHYIKLLVTRLIPTNVHTGGNHTWDPRDQPSQAIFYEVEKRAKTLPACPRNLNNVHAIKTYVSRRSIVKWERVVTASSSTFSYRRVTDRRTLSDICGILKKKLSQCSLISQKRT